jgi:hypothetical protein
MTDFRDYALAEVHVDPKVAAAFAAWLTDLAGHAVSASPRADVPEWVGTAAELLYDWAEEIPWANGEVGTAGQIGTTLQSLKAGACMAGSLGDVLTKRLIPAVPTRPLLERPLDAGAAPRRAAGGRRGRRAGRRSAGRRLRAEGPMPGGVRAGKQHLPRQHRGGPGGDVRPAS